MAGIAIGGGGQRAIDVFANSAYAKAVGGGKGGSTVGTRGKGIRDSFGAAFRKQQKIEDFETSSGALSQRAAEKFASSEAQKNRDFELQKRREAFQQFSGFISPLLQELTGGGTGTESGDLSTSESAGLRAVESGIESRGEAARSKLKSSLARRGIFRSGVGVAAEAKQIGETEAQVSTARGQFAESAAERRLKERLSKRSTLASVIGGAGGFL